MAHAEQIFSVQVKSVGICRGTEPSFSKYMRLDSRCWDREDKASPLDSITMWTQRFWLKTYLDKGVMSLPGSFLSLLELEEN